MGFIHVLCTNDIENLLCGRHNIYLQTVTAFFDVLKENGAKMVFICDGKIYSNKLDEWSKRRSKEYGQSVAVMQNLMEDAFMLRGSARPPKIGIKYVAKSFLKVVENYGEVVTATEADCDMLVVSYACDNDVLAVIGSDSDYLVYEGNWQFWHTDFFNIEKLMAMKFDRELLRSTLNLSSDQMKIFATILGNDYTKSLRRKPIGAHLPDRKAYINYVSQFCETLQLPFTRTLYADIKNRFFEGDTEEVVRAIDMSIESYSVSHFCDLIRDEFESYTVGNVLMTAILNESIFQYEANYIDFKERLNNNNSDGKHFMDDIVNVFRKLGGILLKDKMSAEPTLKIFTKFTQNTPYELKEFTPIYPKGQY